MVASLCKDVSLLGDLAYLTAQQNQLLPLSCSQLCVGFAAAQRISLGLANPGADASFVATKLFCKLNGLAPNADQLDHLLAKLGRIRPSSLAHKELLWLDNNVSGSKGQLQTALAMRILLRKKTSYWWPPASDAYADSLYRTAK